MAGGPTAQQRDEMAHYMRLYPEVQWDRWAGSNVDPAELGYAGYYVAFGWHMRPDGRSDFLVLQFVFPAPDGGSWPPGTPWARVSTITSSAQHSAAWAERANPGAPHTDCKRVEYEFAGLVPNAVVLPPPRDPLLRSGP